MPRLLLTGASGFLGQHLLRALQQDGHDVTAVVRRDVHLPCRTMVADLADASRFPSLVAGHEVLVHAALLWGEPQDDLRLRDTAAAAQLFDAAGKAGLHTAVYLSSTAVHRPFHGTLRATDALHPTDTYGATKAAGELMLSAACAQHGLRGVSLRVAPVVGPPAAPNAPQRLPRALTSLLEAAHDGTAWQPPPGTAAGRQLVSPRDLCRVVTAALGDADLHGPLIVADHTPTRWAALAHDLGVPVAGTLAPQDHHFDVAPVEALLGGPLDCRPLLTQSAPPANGMGPSGP